MRREIEAFVQRQGGIVFANPAIVCRNSYSGRGLFAAAPLPVRDRSGYAPVEWWVLSTTQAENPDYEPGEGITRLILGDAATLPLTEALGAAGQCLFGSFLDRWPLTKILDIGGAEVIPDFTDRPEVPPIPPHVHAGIIRDGKAQPPGKHEAYFFPPVGLPPYNLEIRSAKTRLGLKPGTRRDDFIDALSQFGRGDALYDLLNEYPVCPFEGWTIPPRIVHSPGPWPTLELQTPQDDFNLAAWQLAKRLEGDDLKQSFESLVLRGLDSPKRYLEELVDWETSTAADFQERFHHKSRIVERGSWGNRSQIFFGRFYGEALHLEPGQRRETERDIRPVGAIVWCGRGLVNGMEIDANEYTRREFLVTPGHSVEWESLGEHPLIVLLVYPMQA